ncbi:hypothetical protein QBC43DRAFT_322558 [Cladorrhinum sp. PSN259]|nr:hypothetical protein QBC43DRAFT_322558 [Cladorrhinum sp. PSN259]
MHFEYLSVVLLSGLAAASPLKCRQALPSTTTVSAAPATPTPSTPATKGTAPASPATDEIAKAVKAIMPSSNSCDGAQGPPGDCRTADQAAPFIAASSAGLSPGELAGTLALMGLESGDLKFKHNVSPGRPGQGTAGMLMPNFVAEYAASIFGQEAIAGKEPAAILEMVTVDEHNFGSVRWFLEDKCDASVRAALKTGTDAGFTAYMGCVGVDANDGARLAYWNRAKAAFSL